MESDASSVLFFSFLPVGLVLSCLAALAAFLITYDEWLHHYPTRREPFRYALQAALVTFGVFAGLTVLICASIVRVIGG